jgi:hypothetical protein
MRETEPVRTARLGRAVRFHERRAAAQATAQKVAAMETPLPEITVPKRRRKAAPAAAAVNGRAEASSFAG